MAPRNPVGLIGERLAFPLVHALSSGQVMATAFWFLAETIGSTHLRRHCGSSRQATTPRRGRRRKNHPRHRRFHLFPFPLRSLYN